MPSRKRVLEEAKKLVHNHIVTQTKFNGDTAYEKDPFYYGHKKKILSLARDKRKLSQFPTKATPRVTGGGQIVIRIPKQRVATRMITVDDIDAFAKIRKLKKNRNSPTPIAEKKFKKGIQQIIGESGSFRDWGGETNDLWTTRARINGRRLATAFAFKGPGKRGKLVPGSMGKNGDQIQRLFQSPAEVFIVQYWAQIAESVLHQMAEFAKAKSVSDGKLIFYGIIDGQDSNRILQAYPKAFQGA